MLAARRDRRRCNIDESLLLHAFHRATELFRVVWSWLLWQRIHHIRHAKTAIQKNRHAADEDKAEYKPGTTIYLWEHNRSHDYAPDKAGANKKQLPTPGPWIIGQCIPDVDDDHGARRNDPQGTQLIHVEVGGVVFWGSKCLSLATPINRKRTTAARPHMIAVRTVLLLMSVESRDNRRPTVPPHTKLEPKRRNSQRHALG